MKLSRVWMIDFEDGRWEVHLEFGNTVFVLELGDEKDSAHVAAKLRNLASNLDPPGIAPAEPTEGDTPGEGRFLHDFFTRFFR